MLDNILPIHGVAGLAFLFMASITRTHNTFEMPESLKRLDIGCMIFNAYFMALDHREHVVDRFHTKELLQTLQEYKIFLRDK